MERVADVTARLTLAASVVLQAVITASLGLSLNEADSLLMLVVAASACMLCGALVLRGDDGGRTWGGATTAPLISLNFWTAVSFISFFLGVAIHSAAVVFTLEASCAPLGLIVWAALRARGAPPRPRPGPAQCWAACLLAALGMLLVAVIAGADPGGKTELFVASALGVLAGFAAGRVAHISRDLGRRGVGVAQVMTHRFHLTTFVAMAALLTLVPGGVLAPPALPVGVIGAGALASILVPIYLLQYSMQRVEPPTVTAALATMPTIAIAVELASGRSVSWIVLLLGALLVPGNLALMLTQAKTAKPPGARPLYAEMEYS
jgi:hypothetical protein